MSPFSWICIIFIAYWVMVWLWIKGTDPLSNVVFHWIWTVIKIVLTCGVGFLVFAFLCRGKD